MDNFKRNEKVSLFYLGDINQPIPFDKVLICDCADNLNDPDVIKVVIYNDDRFVGHRYYNRGWIKKIQL